MKTFLPSEVKDDFANKLDAAVAGEPFLIHRGENLLIVQPYDPLPPEIEPAALERAAAKISAQIEADKSAGRLKEWHGLESFRKGK